MAQYYIWSGATGAGDGSSWANAYTTIAAAITAHSSTAGDTFFIAHDHTQTTGSSVSFFFGGTPADNPNLFISVNRSGSVPPVIADLLRGAQVNTNVAGGQITFNEGMIFWGVEFNCSVGGASGSGTINNNGAVLLNCGLYIFNTGASNSFAFGTAPGHMRDCDFIFGATGQGFNVNTHTTMRNCTLGSTGVTPTTLFKSVNAPLILEACDFSNLGSNTLLNISTQYAIVRDVKLNVSTTKVGATITKHIPQAIFSRSGSSVDNNEMEVVSRAGSLLTEKTIVRTGGASDGNTPISWKFVTSSVASIGHPLEGLPIQFWNETVGSSITVTIEGVWEGATLPTKEEAWILVEYLGSSSEMKGSISLTNSGAPLGSTTGVSSSETWTTTGLTTPGKFKMSVTITPQQKGPIAIYSRFSKPSSTMYLDPKPVVT